jgi:ABC-type cobalt transport system substrate-binding protein
MRLFFLVYILLIFALPALGGEKPEAKKWPGVDEAVVEKIAKEHGRETREPLINTDKGDILLFVFLLAGTVGGFVAGYSWRALMEKRKEPETSSFNTADNDAGRIKD